MPSSGLPISCDEVETLDGQGDDEASGLEERLKVATEAGRLDISNDSQRLRSKRNEQNSLTNPNKRLYRYEI